MKVHYLQHVSFEGLGYIETWLKENDHVVSVTRFYEDDYRLPSIAEIDALIVMGGPMGVYDGPQFSWLEEEKIFIKNCIHSGKKVLGICLGAQLIADCLGAKINQAAHKEIGWFPVSPTNESKQLSWFYELFQNNPMVFHWHGDRFEIPAESLNLLSSAGNDNQAFYYNKNILGLQFHLEVTKDTIVQMLESGSTELVSSHYIQKAGEIRSETGHIEACNKIMSAILGKWIGGF